MMPERPNPSKIELEEWCAETEGSYRTKKSNYFTRKFAKAKETLKDVGESLGRKKTYETIGPEESFEAERKEASVPLEKSAKELELEEKKLDLKGVALDKKTDQEKYAKYLAKGQTQGDVRLDEERPEKDSRNNVNLDTGVDDFSVTQWTIYTIKIPATKLNSWQNLGFQEDLELPLCLTLENKIHKKLLKDANWVAKITASAEKEATTFIASLKTYIIETPKPPSIEELRGFLQPCTARLEKEVSAFLISYKETKEELRKFQGKAAVNIGWDVGKATFHIGHSAATMGASAPVGFLLAAKNIGDLAQECAKIGSNPGTIAIEIHAGFKAIQEVRKTGVVGENLMSIVATGVSLAGNKTLPLNLKDLKKKIEVDHKMAIASLMRMPGVPLKVATPAQPHSTTPFSA